MTSLWTWCRKAAPALILSSCLAVGSARAQVVDDLLDRAPGATAGQEDAGSGADIPLNDVHPGLAPLKEAKKKLRQGRGIMVWPFEPYEDPVLIDLRRRTWTVIEFPQWEQIDFVTFGDEYAFEHKFPGEDSGAAVRNILLVRPKKKVVEVDTTMHVFGRRFERGRNIYTAFLHIQASDDTNMAEATVHVEARPPGLSGLVTAPGYAGQAVEPMKAAGAVSGTGKGALAQRQSRPRGAGSAWDGTLGTDDPDWLREIPFNLDAVRFDGYEVLAQDSESETIAPVRVFDDGTFTMLDFGEGGRADRILRPIVFQVVDGANSPVNTRTTGPEGNLLVIEGVGYNLTLVNGARVVCVKYVGNYLKLPGQSSAGGSKAGSSRPARPGTASTGTYPKLNDGG